LHKPIPLGTDVIVPTGNYSPGKLRAGKVVGIAMFHVIFNYIVLLDDDIIDEYGAHKAISVPGTILETSDGGNWRLE